MSKLSRRQRSKIVCTVLKKVTIYRHCTNKFPIDPVADIYRPLTDDVDWAAIRVLLKRQQHILDLERKFKLAVPKWKQSESSFWQKGISFTLPPGMKLPQMQFSAEDLAAVRPRAYEALMGWYDEEVRLRRLEVKLERMLKAMLGNYESYSNMNVIDPCCNTLNQVYKLWPELLPFFPEFAQTAVRKSTLRTRLPKEFRYTVYADKDNEVRDEITKKGLEISAHYVDTDTFMGRPSSVVVNHFGFFPYKQHSRSVSDIQDILLRASLFDDKKTDDSRPSLANYLFADLL